MQDFVFGSWQITSAPECGGNLARVRWQGRDIMRGFADRASWDAAPTDYGFPVLFPPNRIDGGIFRFQGREYRLPVNEPDRNNHLHGIALREQWHSGGSSRDSLSMFWDFDKSSPMYANYPFDCKFSVTYTFDRNILTQDFRVENRSAHDIPCALGFHSAFAIPEKMLIHGSGGRFEILPPRHLISGREISWTNGFEPDKWCDPAAVWPFGHLRADETRLAELDYGDFKIEYKVDEKFAYWMIWRPEQDKTFICIEPMNIKVGCFENTPELLPVLKPGEYKSFISQIKIIS